MNFYIGTSGFAYKPWKGKFYPEDLPDKLFLRFYSEYFPTVEINNTFHRMPKASVLEQWSQEVPNSFRFVLKAPQRITHFQRLKNTDNSLAYFFQVTSILGDRLGAFLFQTPPNLPRDIARLEDFLACFPAGCRAAFEFRHESWFEDQVYEVLRKKGAALCIADADSPLKVPFVSTASWGYLRLRRAAYGDPDLERWADQVNLQQWSDAFVFFKHEDDAKGPQMALKFMEKTGGVGPADRQTRPAQLGTTKAQSAARVQKQV